MPTGANLNCHHTTDPRNATAEPCSDCQNAARRATKARQAETRKTRTRSSVPASGTMLPTNESVRRGANRIAR